MKFPFLGQKKNDNLPDPNGDGRADKTKTLHKPAEVLETIKALKRIQEEARSLTTEVFSFEPVRKKVEEGTKIVLLSDVHIGSIFTDYQVLSDVLEYIMENDDVKVIFNGDLVDNFTRKLAFLGVEEQIVSPSTQREIFVGLLESLAPKIIAFNVGNHEEFSDLDYIRLYKRQHPNVTFFLNRGKLELEVGERVWNVALVHKSRYNSTINPVHTGIRELQLNYPDADVIIMGHTHENAIARVPYCGRMVYLVKVPALKFLDPFSYRFFDPYRYEPEVPVLEVYSDRIKVHSNYR